MCSKKLFYCVILGNLKSFKYVCMFMYWCINYDRSGNGNGNGFLIMIIVMCFIGG